jgi:Tol biopolymer transport system component
LCLEGGCLDDESQGRKVTPGTLESVRRLAVGMVLALVGLSTLPAQAATHFVETPAPAAFGQAPVFMPDGRVVWSQNLGTGQGEQIYLALLDGSKRRCLTCGEPGPNGVPAVRPQGDWILFHSWRGHHITLGSPGYGGLGSALYVMRPDGSDVTALTVPDAGNGEGEDDYHAYWSPDGKQVAWAHLNWDFLLTGGQGRWDVRVADFVTTGGHPHLVNQRVVRPANGHWYETQWWAPDGSGFLYTETWGSAMNPELFFCRLTVSGCVVTQLTHDTAWDEQAVFTADGRHVIFMSTRDHAGLFNTFSSLASLAGLPTEDDYLLALPLFEAGFLQPVLPEATDLYELDIAGGAVRRLTDDGDDGWVTPEFAWSPGHRFLLWTELKVPDGLRVQAPLDAAEQLRALAAYLAHPPSAPAPLMGGALQTVPFVLRTREGTLR